MSVEYETCYPEYRGTFQVPEFSEEATEREQRTVRRRRRAGGNFRVNKRLVEAATAEEVLEIVEKELGNFNFVNISTCMYRLALVAQPLTPLHRSHIRQDPRLKGLLREISDTLRIDAEAEGEAVLSPKEVSNLVWATTKLGASDAELFEAFGRSATRHMEQYDSVNVSLTLWGFAKMDQKNDRLFQGARCRVVSLLPAFEPHRLCNTAWAYAKMAREGEDSESFFRALAEEAYRKSGKFNTSNESMLLYSLALAGCYYKPLFDRFLSRLERAINADDLADPRSLSNLVWSLVQLDKHANHISLIDAVVSSTIANINRYSLTHLATLLGAIVKASYTSSATTVLFSKAYEQTKAKYSPNVPFEQGASDEDLEVLRHAFTTHCGFLDIFPAKKKIELEPVKASDALFAKAKSGMLWDVLGTLLIGVVLMAALELVRTMTRQ